MLRDKITQFYVELDDFCKEFEQELSKRPVIEGAVKSRRRAGNLSDAEMMSSYLLFHFGQFTNFKSFYTMYVQKHLVDLFPDVIRYERFNARQLRILYNTTHSSNNYLINLSLICGSFAYLVVYIIWCLILQSLMPSFSVVELDIFSDELI